MNKKVVFGVVAAGVLLGAAVLFPIASMALDSSQGTTFVQKLAAKLGIDESKVQTAVDSIRDDVHSERLASLKIDLQKLVENGKLTQRQSDLILAADEARYNLKDSISKPIVEDKENKTMAQIKEEMEKFRTEMEQKIVDALNAKGLNTSATELKSAMEAARSAGLKPFMKGKGHEGGMGMMMH